jgi:hypothetical protein
MSIEKEIEDSKNRIEERQSTIEVSLSKLDDKISIYTKWAWGFVFTGFIVAIISSIYFIYSTDGKTFELNLLGDFLSGSVASIWSLAGLFFIYVAFLGQKQQLLNQQLEIMYSQLEYKHTRLELIAQKKEMKLQNETLRIQKFENTFFQMLNLFNDTVNSLNLKEYEKVTHSGRQCFMQFYNFFTTELYFIDDENKRRKEIKSCTLEQTIKAFNTFYFGRKSDLSHYFRTLYHLIKFIDKSNISDKNQYISITRAQLSSFEQSLLFYNCLHSNGKEKFKPLIEKYCLFKNIDISLIINREHFKEYNKSAFVKDI